MVNYAYNAVGGLGTSQGIQQSYANMINMNDMASNLGTDNGLSFNSGIFNQMGQYGQYGQYSGQCGQYPGSETEHMSLVDLDAYQAQRQKLQMAQQTDLQKLQMQQQIALQKQGASAEFQVTGADGAISNNIGFLQDAVKENNQDEFSAIYTKVDKAARAKLKEDGVELSPTATKAEKEAYEEKVRAYVNQLYTQATGTNLVQDMKSYGDGPLAAGFKSGLDPFGWFTNKTSLATNMQKAGGPAASETEGSTKTVGKVLGFVALGIALPVVALAAPRLISKLFKGEWSLLKLAAGVKDVKGIKSFAKAAPLAGDKLVEHIGNLEIGLKEANKLNKGASKSDATQKVVEDLAKEIEKHKAMAATEKLTNLEKLIKV